jgi:hypothetical protein
MDWLNAQPNHGLWNSKQKLKIKCTNYQSDQGYDVHRYIVIQGHNIQKLEHTRDVPGRDIQYKDVMTKVPSCV